ncbi:Der1-like protein [Saccharata proteae CBS 121410]|uniref:Derlin n=1 Tax=Saccharata proteae CBS 121410 TaxID=1314787 RepID=A0A9P4HUD3_9PEZI|nr:Der1-like protein [Saccharata proteae CBS 121410]
MDVFWSWPPVTRTITVAAMLTSVLAYSGLISFMPIVFIPQKMLAIPPQVWRLVTSFCITGPQLSIIFEPYFFFQYGSQLEKGSPRFTEAGSFLVYIIFNALIIVPLLAEAVPGTEGDYPCISHDPVIRKIQRGRVRCRHDQALTGFKGLAGYVLQGFRFLDALTMAVMYTWAQDNSNTQVTFFVITVPGRYLPYLYLLVSFVMGGPAVVLHQGTGLLAAHMYDFLTRIWPTFGGGRNVISTPGFLRQWFGGAAPQQRGYGVAFAAREPAPQGRATGWSNQRGPGRRLGSD